MIAKVATIAFAGGATLALLGGCVPATSNQPVPPSYSYAPPQMVQPAYEQVPEWFWHQSPAAPVITQAAPAPQPAPRKRLDPDAVAGNPPPHASPLPAKPPPSDDPDCRSWWDLCHFI